VATIVKPRPLAVGAAMREQPVYQCEPGRESLDRLGIEAVYDSNSAHAATFSPEGGASLAAAHLDADARSLGKDCPRWARPARIASCREKGEQL